MSPTWRYCPLNMVLSMFSSVYAADWSLATFFVEESKQLPAQLRVGHGLREKDVLLGQLLSCELLRVARHPLVVVEQRHQGGVGGFGEERALIQELEQAERTMRTG